MLTRDYYLPFYEEVLEFLAGGPSSKQLVAYRPSPTAQARFSWLLEENRQRRLNPEEEQELEHYVALERMLSLLKAKAFGRQATRRSMTCRSVRHFERIPGLQLGEDVQ